MYRSKLRALGVTTFFAEETEISDNIIYFKQVDPDLTAYSSTPRRKKSSELKSGRCSLSANVVTTVKTTRKPLKLSSM